MNADGVITALDNEGCDIEDIRDEYTPGDYYGFYLVNVASERNGILTFYNTDEAISDVKNAFALSCEFHEDGYDVIGIDDNKYVGETLAKISSRATNLEAGIGNAIIEVDERQIVRVFSFVDQYALGGGGSSDDTINPDNIYIDEECGFEYGAVTYFNEEKNTITLAGIGSLSLSEVKLVGDIKADDLIVYYFDDNDIFTIEKVEEVTGAVESFTEDGGVVIAGNTYHAWIYCEEVYYGDLFQYYMENKSAMGANTKYYVYNNLILEIVIEEDIADVSDYAVITRSYYDTDMDTAYVKLAFADNSEGTYQVGKTYLKNTREPNDEANSGNRPQDFANNRLFGIVVKYKVRDNGTLDLSGQDFNEILTRGNTTTKYIPDATGIDVYKGNLDGYYGLNDNTIVFALYGNPCYELDGEEIKMDATNEDYAPIKAKAYKLSELVDMEANAIDTLYVGKTPANAPIVSYVLNSRTDVNKYIVAAAMTIGKNLASGNIAYKESCEFAYVVKATQYYNSANDSYYAELTLINEGGLFTAKTIENVTNLNAVEILDNGVIGNISDPRSVNCKFARGSFVRYDMNESGVITALENEGCDLYDIRTDYESGINYGLYLVNVYKEHNGMLRFFNTRDNIDDISSARLQTVSYHEDGYDIIGIGNNTYVGSKLATLPASTTELEAYCGNAIIEIDEGEIVRVFSFNNGYWCEGTIVPEYYSITFDANGGVFTISEQTADIGEELIITREIPTMNGYTFKGWGRKPDAKNAEYHPGEKYVGSDVTLYAIWEPNAYELKYLVDGEEYKAFEYGYLDEITAEAAPVKTGYAFSGWFGVPDKMPSKDVTVTGGFVALDDKTCGDNLTWSISSKGILTVSGSGAMEDYDLVSSFAPWSPYREKITSVVLGKDVSYVGDYAFFGCNNIESISIADSIEGVGIDAFTSEKTVTVYGDRGSFAEDYAEEKGFAFVVPTAATGITLNKAAIELEAGESFELVATVLPEDAMDKSVSWSSSNGKAAKVDANGKVVAVATGTATITAKTADGKYSAVCDVTVIDNPSVEAKFTLSDEIAQPGDIIDVRLSLKSNIELNSIALSDVGYDSNVLEFVGFADYEHLDDMCAMPIEYFVDNENMIIAVPLSASQVFSGDICTLQFKVKDTVSDCTTTITATGTAKNNADVLNAVVAPASIIVRTQLPGDIDGDGTVNIKDAVRLFQHSMLPERYPIAYAGDLDFTKDGAVDINDAVRLFQYSMLPDVYPID